MKISEIFGENVIQGEGPYAGHPCTFVRTYGCVEPYCDFCDTKYSWDKSVPSIDMNVDEIMNQIISFGNKFVVITGGEPYIQTDIYDLLKTLIDNGYTSQVETSGKTHIVEKLGAIIIMSPKQYKGKFIYSDEYTLSQVDYLKFVIEDKEELTNVMGFVIKKRIEPHRCYLMAKGHTREKQIELMPFVIESAAKLGFLYSPRLHVLAYDTKRGV